MMIIHCLIAALTLMIGSAAMAGEPTNWKRYPITAVPTIAQPPTIDGNVERREWQAATSLTNLVDMLHGLSDDDRRETYIACDAENLYFAFRLHRPAGAEKPGMPDHVGEMHGVGTDAVELMIDTNHNASNYYNFVLFANGAYIDGIGSPGLNKTIDHVWQRAASLTDEGWQGEVAIPWTSLGLDGPPAPDAVLGFDFVDNRRTPMRAVRTWSYRGQSWHKFENFGHLRFSAPDAPAVRYLRAGDVGGGKALAEFEIVNAGDVSADVAVSLQVLKRKPGAEGGAKSYYDNIESGGDDAYNTGAVDFYKGTKLEDLIDDTFNSYVALEEAAISKVEALPGGQRRGVGVTFANASGEYLVAYNFAHAETGEPLLQGVMPFTIRPPLAMTVEPYWLYSQVLDVTVDLRKLPLPEKGGTVTVGIYPKDGEGAALKQSSAAARTGQQDVIVTVPTDGLDPKMYKLQVTVLDDAGKAMASNAQMITRPENPPWYANDHGKRTEVPKPWEPIDVAADGTVKMWGRTYKLGSLLPTSITSQGEELLDAPIAVELLVDGKPLAWKVASFELVEKSKGKATFRGTLENDVATLSGTAEIEYDGFLWYTLDLTPKQAFDLERGRIAIRRKPDHVRLITGHRPLGFEGLPKKKILPAEGDGAVLDHPMLQPFRPYYWVGDRYAGLAYIGEGMKHWKITQPNHVVQLLPPGVEGNAAHMRISFIDHETKLDKPLRLEFGFQASPIRPLPPAQLAHVYQQSGMIGEADKWEAIANAGAVTAQFFHWKGGKSNGLWAGFPTLSPLPERHELLKRGIGLAHDAGVKVALYTGWGVDRHYDAYKLFGPEMIRFPIENAGFGTYRQSAGLNGGYTDYMAWAHAQLAQTYKNDGVHWDSTMNMQMCRNLRIGNGWVDEKGNVHGTYAVRATRDLLRRVYNVYNEEQRPEARINIGSGGIWCINVYGTTYHKGEGTPMHVRKLINAWNPLENYQAYYWARPFGMNFLGMNKNFKGLPMTVNRHLAIFLLHGDLYKKTGHRGLDADGPWNYSHGARPAPGIWHARMWLGMDDAERFYYFEQDRHQAVSLEPANLLSSSFVSKDKKRALVVVSNLHDKPVQGGKVQLHVDRLGLASSNLAAEDVITVQPVEIAGGAMTLDIESERYRLLKVWVSE